MASRVVVDRLVEAVVEWMFSGCLMDIAVRWVLIGVLVWCWTLGG